MRKIIFTAMLLFASAVSNAYADGETNCVFVRGTAELEAEPNEIWLAITVNERDSKGKITVEEQENVLKKVLKEAGIDVKTSLFVDNMSSSFYKRGTGLTSKNYTLKLSDASAVAAIFYGLNSNGITDVNVVKVTRNDIPELKRSLRIESIKNAKMKAEELAGAIGQSVGKAIYIEDYNMDADSPVMVRYANTKALMSVAGAVEDALEESPEFRKIKLSYSVSVRFELN